MLNEFRGRLLLLAILSSPAIACSGGTEEDAAGGGDNGRGEGEAGGAVAPYTLTCEQNSCDSCRDAARARSSECFRLCSNPYAPANCYSRCDSIGDTSCPYDCGENARCEKWHAALPKPERDESLFQACMTYGMTCAPDAGEKFLTAQCDAEARLEQPRVGDAYECATEQACTPTVPCLSVMAGTLGTELCQRAASCGTPCRPAEPGFSSDEDFINGWEHTLRPSLVALTRQCIAETSCERFVACNDALDYLWQLSWHNYSGT